MAQSTPADPATTGAEPTTPNADAQVIMIIRHGEKPPGSGAEPYGITFDGKHDHHALTPFGWARAGALVGLFAPLSGSVRTGLVRPVSIFAARPDVGGHQREAQTVSLVARQLGVEVEMPCAVGQEPELAATLRARGGPILVAWEHKHIADIAEQLGDVAPRVPSAWPEDRFDMVYVLQRSGPDSYAFTQVPQLLLPGDDSTPIV